VQQTAKASQGNRPGIGLTEISRVGIRVYLAVGRGGTPPTSFDVTSITGRRTPGGQLLVVAHVRNTGGRALDLNGTVRLADGPGGTSAGPFPVQKIVTIAPGQSWDMVFVVPHTLPAGSWRATVRLASGLTRATGAATVMLAAAAAAQAALSGVPWLWAGAHRDPARSHGRHGAVLVAASSLPGSGLIAVAPKTVWLARS
jgi:hypothetical protein